MRINNEERMATLLIDRIERIAEKDLESRYKIILIRELILEWRDA